MGIANAYEKVTVILPPSFIDPLTDYGLLVLMAEGDEAITIQDALSHGADNAIKVGIGFHDQIVNLIRQGLGNTECIETPTLKGEIIRVSPYGLLSMLEDGIDWERIYPSP